MSYQQQERKRKGEKRNHHPLPTTQDKSFLLVISPPFPCFSTFPHILFFRCCSTQSPHSARLSWWLLSSSDLEDEDVGCSPLFSQTLFGRPRTAHFPEVLINALHLLLCCPCRETCTGTGCSPLQWYRWPELHFMEECKPLCALGLLV